VKPDVINRGKLFLNRISVLEEALTASKIEGVSSIHTPTEGGVLNGLMEIANASGFGFRIYAENLLVADETRIICEALGIDPLRLLSSGSLLIVVNPDVIDQVLDAFVKKGIRASIIGEFKEGESVIVDKDGVESPAFFVEQDELFRILEESE
jgi:hydrogenase maturation factor